MFCNKNVSLMCLVILSTYFLLGMTFYIPNMAGVGLELPQNILCWMAMMSVVMIVSLLIMKKKTISYDAFILFFVVAIILFSLPVIWGREGEEMALTPKLLMLIGGGMFYVTLLQISFSEKVKKQFVWMLIFAAVIQCCLALWQVNVADPDNWMEFIPGIRPYGIFQQVNVLASFVATGFAGATCLLFVARRRIVVLMSSAAIILFTTVLTILQSRTGWSGVILFTGFAFLVYGRKRMKRTVAVLLLCISTITFIHLFKMIFPGNNLLSSIDTINKTSSNYERIAILKATIQMILLHPVSGWGYGSYETVVSRISESYLHHVFPDRVTHPHNEFLFEWAEGGVSAAAGVLVMLGGYLMLLIKGHPHHRLRWGMSIPCVVHTMFEYPLAQSSAHWLALLLICRLAVREKDIKQRAYPEALYYLQTGAAFLGILFLLTGFRTNAVLTQFERSDMTDFSKASTLVNPWAQWDRFEYDKNVNLLMQFNKTKNKTLLREYYGWATGYLQRKNDRHVAMNVRLIAQHLHLPAEKLNGQPSN